MLMPHWLEKRSSLTPERIALRMNAEAVTFNQLRANARSLAYKLKSLTIKKGDVIAILSSNSIAYVEIVHAMQYVGAIFLPLNTRLSEYELVFQVKDANAKLLLYSDEYSEAAEQLRTIYSMNSLSITELVKKDEKTAQQEAWQDQLYEHIDVKQVHTMMYTSGTTGQPKGVMLTGENHWSSAIGSALNLGLHEQDCWLLAVPMFHISGLSILMRSVIYGIPVVIQQKFDAEQANAAIIEQGVTIVSVVSNMLSRMLQALDEQRYPEHFRCMLLGGGPAPKPLLEKCIDKGIPMFQTYGMTETASQIVTLQPEYMLSKLGSAGKALFQSEVQVMVDGRLAEAHEAGEIVVRGPNVAIGYFNRPEANKESFIDGWLYTGDIGYMDEEGFLYVLDRRKDMFVSGGENVYPAEIEAALIAHEAVIEAGVTSIPDERWDYIPVAFVVIEPKLMQQLNQGIVTEQELIKQLEQFCQKRLAKYKVPKKIYIQAALPRNASNKLLRRELLKLIEQ